jgi:hypothetical protein
VRFISVLQVLWVSEYKGRKKNEQNQTTMRGWFITTICMVVLTQTGGQEVVETTTTVAATTTTVAATTTTVAATTTTVAATTTTVAATTTTVAATTTTVADTTTTVADTTTTILEDCSTDFYVEDGACVTCDDGNFRPAPLVYSVEVALEFGLGEADFQFWDQSNRENNPGTGSTKCKHHVCPEAVKDHTCVPCKDGQVPHDHGRTLFSTHLDEVCDAIICEENQFVKDNACEDCAVLGPGLFRPKKLGEKKDHHDAFGLTDEEWGIWKAENNDENDASKGPNTCKAHVCKAAVENNKCVPCKAGTTIEGTRPSTANKACAATTCNENEFVSDNACKACGEGFFRDQLLGPHDPDNPFGLSDFAWDAWITEDNNNDGNDASKGDTTCKAHVCDVDKHVVDHICEECPDGAKPAEGNHATNEHHTTCVAKFECALKGARWHHRVENHECVNCPAGHENLDHRTHAPTTEENGKCTPKHCKLNERATGNNLECEDCPAGKENTAAIDAGQGDAANETPGKCEPIQCNENYQHVFEKECVHCPDQSTFFTGRSDGGGIRIDRTRKSSHNKKNLATGENNHCVCNANHAATDGATTCTKCEDGSEQDANVDYFVVGHAGAYANQPTNQACSDVETCPDQKEGAIGCGVHAGCLDSGQKNKRQCTCDTGTTVDGKRYGEIEKELQDHETFAGCQDVDSCAFGCGDDATCDDPEGQINKRVCTPKKGFQAAESIDKLISMEVELVDVDGVPTWVDVLACDFHLSLTDLKSKGKGCNGDPLATCSADDQTNTRTCTCADGSSGTTVDIPDLSPHVKCTDNNGCAKGCGDNAECQDTGANTRTCTCNRGYSGTAENIADNVEHVPCGIIECDHAVSNCTVGEVVLGKQPDNCYCADIVEEEFVGSLHSGGGVAGATFFGLVVVLFSFA